jgi:hypothetical protein
VPVCAQILDAAVAAGEVRPGLDAPQLMRGVGNLCIGAENASRNDARPLVALLVAGCGRRTLSLGKGSCGRGSRAVLDPIEAGGRG